MRTLIALASCVALAPGVEAAGCNSNGAGVAPTPTRTLIARPLTVGSPRNLLLDPFVGGELKSGWGHFNAYYDTGTTAARALIGAGIMSSSSWIATARSLRAACGFSRHLKKNQPRPSLLRSFLGRTARPFRPAFDPLI